MLKIGIGYDVHRLVSGKELILGGEKIPFEKGLFAHSDGDVLIHAICDGLLGAAGLEDIGVYFPNTDDKYRGISSIKLLAEVKVKLKASGFECVNIDSVVIADRPVLRDYRGKIKANISSCLGIAEEDVNVKATTSEGVGYIGSHAIAAYAVALINRVIPGQRG